MGCCYRTASFCWVYSGYLTVFCKYISCYPADCILLLSDTDEEELSRLAEAAVSGHSVIQGPGGGKEKAEDEAKTERKRKKEKKRSKEKRKKSKVGEELKEKKHKKHKKEKHKEKT